MDKENPNENHDNTIRGDKIEKEKNKSSFIPLNEREQNYSRINPNLINIQNSACKNLKNDIKSEPANNFM